VVSRLHNDSSQPGERSLELPVRRRRRFALNWNSPRQERDVHYRSSRGPDGAMWGNFTIRACRQRSPLLGLNLRPHHRRVGAVIVAVVRCRLVLATDERAPEPPPPEQS